MEIKIKNRIPPQLEQYIKDFYERTNFTIFAIGDKLFELTENCGGDFSLKCNKLYIAHCLMGLEDIYEAITKEINK